MTADSRQQPPASNPYVGPVAFDERHTLYGRDRETQALFDLIVSKRIVLLIAPSGAGKTSLIRAALIPKLRSLLHPLPIARLNLEHDGSDIRRVNRYVLSALKCFEADRPTAERLPDPVLAEYTISAYCRHRTPLPKEGRRKHLLLVFDQFEELFTLDRFDWEEKAAFLRQLAEALGGASDAADADVDAEAGATLPVWALLSMREDYAAELEPYLDVIPTGLAFRYRLERLERERAIEAVTGPSGGYFEKDAAALLVDGLRAVHVPSVDGAEAVRLGRFVEPVQLQIMCSRLWDDIVAKSQQPVSRTDVETASRAGEFDTALADYYDAEVARAVAARSGSERELRDWIEANLIARRRHRTKAPRDPLGRLDPVLMELSKGHVLEHELEGDREWFELSHDRLINPVLTSNNSWRTAHLSLLQRQAKLWADTGRKDELLFSGAELTEAEAFAKGHAPELTDVDRDFLGECQNERRRRQEHEAANQAVKDARDSLASRNRVLTIAGCVLGAVCVALLFVSVELRSAKNEIEEQRDVVQKALGEKQITLASLAEKSLESSRRTFELIMLQAASQVSERFTPGSFRTLLKVERQMKEVADARLESLLDIRITQALANAPPVRGLEGSHDQLVRALVFSADGARLFSGGWDNRVKVWSTAAAAEGPFRELDVGSDVYAITFSDRRNLLAATSRQGQIHLWDVSGQDPVALATLNSDSSAHKGAVESAAFSPDGELLVTGGYDHRIVVWDVTDARDPKRVSASFSNKCRQTRIYRMAFLAEGSLVSADMQGNVCVWERGTQVPFSGQFRRLLARDGKGRPVGLFGLAVSPNGRWIAGGDNEGTVHVWDLEAVNPTVGERLTLGLTAAAKVFALAFAPDGSRLVAAAADGTIVDWDVAAWERDIDVFPGDRRVILDGGRGEKLYSLAFPPKGDDVVFVGGSRSIWSLGLDAPNALAVRIRGADARDGQWKAVAGTPDAQLVAALSSDGKQIALWRPDGGAYQAFRSPIASTVLLSGIALAPDGEALVTVSCSGEILLRTIAGGAVGDPQELQAAGTGNRNCAAHSIVFSPSGQQFASGNDKVLRVWSRTESGRWSFDQQDCDAAIRSIAFSPKGDALACAGEFLNIWTVRNGRLEESKVRSEAVGDTALTALAFSPDGKSLIAGSVDGSLVEFSLPGLSRSGNSDVHSRVVTAMATGMRGPNRITLSVDAEGQVVLCSDTISEDGCTRLGSSAGGENAGLVATADMTNAVVADRNGLWAWDLRGGALRRRVGQLAGMAP